MPKMHTNCDDSGLKWTVEDQVRQGIHQLIGRDLPDVDLLEWLSPVLDSDSVLEFIRRSRGWSNALGISLAETDACFDRGYRKKQGLFFTPRVLADLVTSHLDSLEGIVVDLSCGAGELLLSALRRGAQGVRGVELELGLAVASAARLRFHFPDRDIAVIWGDGLSEYDFGSVVGVVGNPPYVGEKGNGEFFRRLRVQHPSLKDFFRPRMDLAYLFIARSVQVASGARVVLLTSEYWLQADSADRIRKLITDHAPVQVLDFLGAENFRDAPGHHSLIFVGGGQLVRAAIVGGEGPWPRVQSTHTGVPFGELAHDRQGFVSGLDRLENRPVFLFGEVEVSPGVGKIRPVFRGVDCVANRVFFECPSAHHVLWLDERMEGWEVKLEDVLGFARAKLEMRRECVDGKMPWYRLHWPRRRSEMVKPKLVVPRRAFSPQFSLDLSASAISSDCSYLLAPPDEPDPVAYLVALMWVLNSDSTTQWLKDCGKRKGKQFEFYATPLRAIPIGQLTRWIASAREVLDEIDPTQGPYVDILLK